MAFLTGREPIILRGRLEPIGAVPFHSDGPLTRWLAASKAMDQRVATYIAIHEFSDVAPESRGYCRPHSHDYDEINLFHTASALRVDLLLGAETVRLDAPATVFIPAGLRHAANVHSGDGFLVAILGGGEYRAAP